LVSDSNVGILFLIQKIYSIMKENYEIYVKVINLINKILESNHLFFEPYFYLIYLETMPLNYLERKEHHSAF